MSLSDLLTGGFLGGKKTISCLPNKEDKIMQQAGESPAAAP